MTKQIFKIHNHLDQEDSKEESYQSLSLSQIICLDHQQLKDKVFVTTVKSEKFKYVHLKIKDIDEDSKLL